MYPPKFDYVAASSVDEVVDLLAENGDDAKILAGGQSLIPVLKLRLAEPALLVDVNRIHGLDSVREEAGMLRIGARCRHTDLEHDTLLKRRCPLIPVAGHWVADPIVRNLGTVGGSLVHADPRGDWGSVMLALKATLVIRSRDGQRTVPITDFFKGYFMTAIGPEEFLTEIRVPVPRGRPGGAYLKLERKVGDYATAAAAVHLDLTDGHIGNAGIGLTAVGPSNLQASEAEQALIGQAPSPALFDHAADLAARVAQPDSDQRGSAQYKRSVVRTFVRRGLDQALAAATA